MILVADSGSTKTDWKLWDPIHNDVFSYSSKGLNPYFVSSKEIASVIVHTIPTGIINRIKNVHFYGSGCGSTESKEKVLSGLQNAIPRAKLEVNHDLMGAARALLGSKSGIACILGTGSNACYYNGIEIEEEGISFGYILGDEGSGNHLGKLLLKSIFSKKAPQEISDAFKKQYPELDLSALLKQFYHLPSPNKFLASFSPFILEHRKNAFIKEIIQSSIHSFISEFIDGLLRDKKDSIGFQGSIAYYYKEEIKEIFENRGLNPVSFIEKPIDELLLYHQNL